jgi:hypothetical protein
MIQINVEKSTAIRLARNAWKVYTTADTTWSKKYWFDVYTKIVKKYNIYN